MHIIHANHIAVKGLSVGKLDATNKVAVYQIEFLNVRKLYIKQFDNQASVYCCSCITCIEKHT